MSGFERRIARYLTNKSGFSDQFTATAVGQTILSQAPWLPSVKSSFPISLRWGITASSAASA